MKTAVIKGNMTLELLERINLGNGKTVTFIKNKEKVDFNTLDSEEKRKVFERLSKTDFLFT